MDLKNPCKIFDYILHDGMELFCIVELFLGMFNFYVAMCQIPIVEKLFKGAYTTVHDYEDDMDIAKVCWAVFVFLFMLTLIAQAVLAFLLYFFGWKKKNVMICILWIVFAGINFLWPWIFLTFHLCNCAVWADTYYQFYLMYTLYGIWIVSCFMKEVKGDTRRADSSKVDDNAEVEEKEAEDK